MATQIKFLTEGKNGAVYYPFTHVKGVLTEDGGTLENALASKVSRDEIVTPEKMAEAVQSVISTLDVPTIDIGAAKTLAWLMENDGKIRASVTPIQIEKSQVTDLEDNLDAKAPLESAEFTGRPTAPTAVTETSDAQIATTRFVQQEIDRRASSFQFSVSQGSLVLATLGAISSIIGDGDTRLDVLKDSNGNYIRPVTTSKHVVNPETGYSVFEEIKEIKQMLGDIERILSITLFG